MSEHLHEVGFDMTFNPNVLQVQEVIPGSFLSKDDIDAITYSTRLINNEQGNISGIHVKRQTGEGITGQGLLVRVS